MRSQRSNNRLYYWLIGVGVLLGIFGFFFVQDAARVEWLYSNHFYPIYSYVPTILFSWLPFSVGDLFYVAALCSLLMLCLRVVRFLILRQWQSAGRSGLQFVTMTMVLHHLFYVGWGLNYYRQPLAATYNLEVDHIPASAYEVVLDSLIRRANVLRKQVDDGAIDYDQNKEQLEHVMANDTIFDAVLRKKNIHAKYPISSHLVSYFAVNGYFNPFTHEAHINALTPWPSFPFTVVHELAHQMGIGFEDECNFIAFQILAQHPNPWYAYSAHYSAIQSLLAAMRVAQPESFKHYVALLHPQILRDMQNEREFWSKYNGTVNYISGIFYNHYLQHNNQPEGAQRYGMMNRLIVAWSKKNSY
ncbi:MULTISPECIES: DUF3810 domain-containing protein [Sphingobacterium]|uniref:DUF3810 domain-containing protein n=1 Tax=Sphingobacterium populi TaxID=1812824 RepID=A0ABW5UIC1_9SPHI|nr:DUF3810 domain-containing protein [Sphingobacterium sp. CFCC 11742]